METTARSIAPVLHARLERDSQEAKRKKGEEALEISRANFSSIVERTADGILVLDAGGKVLYANPSAGSLFMRSQEDMGEIWFGRPIATDEMTELDVLRKDGTAGVAEMRLEETDWEGRPAYLAMLRDITDRRRAEEALRRTERTLRSLMDGNPESFIMIDTGGIVLDANKEVARRLGTTVSELIGSPLYDFLPSDVVEERKEHVQEAICTGKPVRFQDICLGRTIDNYVQPIFDEHGTVVNLALLGMDITDMRKAEEVRRRLATAIEQSPNVVMIKDALGCIQYVNPAFEQISGYSREEVIGKVPRFLETEAEDPRVYEELWDAMSRGELYRGRQRFRKKDGTPFIIDLTISPVFDASGKIANYIRLGQDVTERVRLEQQLFQAQKMEAIGTLAGGVAHDFNNLLTVVMGFSDLLLTDMDEQYPSYADLQKINEAAQKGADLVQRLLTFSRRSEVKPRPLNLNHQIEQLQKMLIRTIPKMIEVELNLSGVSVPGKCGPYSDGSGF